jgi:hypothetical protein
MGESPTAQEFGQLPEGARRPYSVILRDTGADEAFPTVHLCHTEAIETKPDTCLRASP